MESTTWLLRVFEKAALCRHFETKAFENIKEKNITFPAYLSAGQEFISATLSTCVEDLGLIPDIFIQHRGHSTYLSFGAKPELLINELLGKKSGCANGMGGSASIHSKEKSIFGHDGLMGSQVPIAVGSCYASRRPTIVFMGDASAEEDYVLGALGWASTKKLPILFVVEDNNLSILTEKKARRNWSMASVAQAFNMKAFDIPDDPIKIKEQSINFFQEPILLNVNTHRMFWHSGAGIDNPDIFDRYKQQLGLLGDSAKLIDSKTETYVSELWNSALKP